MRYQSTGEYRPPRKGEFFMDTVNADGLVLILEAANDFTDWMFYIMEPVEEREVKITSRGDEGRRYMRLLVANTEGRDFMDEFAEYIARGYETFSESDT